MSTNRFAFLRRKQEGGLIHVSHYMQLVSAWESSKERNADLVAGIEEAFTTARATEQPQIMDQDGYMSFIIYPNGHVDLVVAVERFDIATAEDLAEKNL